MPITMKCEDRWWKIGRDKAALQQEAGERDCAKDKSCDGGKRDCVRRSMCVPSKEDPDLYMALVWCPCPTGVGALRTAVPKAKVRAKQRSRR